jgi:Uma2 family endonuclease
MSTLPASKATPTDPRSRPQPAATLIVRLYDREIAIPPSAQTLGGFRAWAVSDDFPERGRISFLNGEITVDMSPEEIESHNKVKSEIGRVLGNLNKKQHRGEFYSDRTLISNEEANLSTEPDAVFALWQTLESGRLRLVPMASGEGSKELEGSPDWVLEILSDSSVRKDTRRLRQGYFDAGVQEYWLVDARGDEIDFQILIRGEEGFEAVEARKGWLLSPLFKRRFRLTRERGPMNLWVYTLEEKAPR